jgi:hypothetical protein
MMKRFLLPIAGTLVIVAVFGIFSGFTAQPAAESLSPRLTDQEFWRLVSEFSEPNGFFRSDNILSNELWFQYVIPDLTRTAKPGRVYLGVGPEQNFTYIAALKPKMVFIFDIRRGNLDLQLMYKALFELSADRADFVSKLFSRPRPDGLGPNASAQRIFDAYRNVDPSETDYSENLKTITELLVTKHRFRLSDRDLEGIEHVYRHFYQFGPRINYNSSLSTGPGRFGFGLTRTSYADLMSTDDGQGQARSYLASEENFGFLKELQSKNLLVPVVGDFAGTKAIRAVASYLKEKDATVSAFYLSNVEQYLRQNGVWDAFCRNVTTLPLDDSSTFIRSVRDGQYGFGRGLSSELGSITKDVTSCSVQ